MNEIMFSNHITSEDKRRFKGIWCDAHLWFYTGLNVMEKMFYLEIDSLDNENGCFATNEHFSKFSGLSKNRCSEIIKSLEQEGAITIEYVYKVKKGKQTRQIDKRIIHVNRDWERAIRDAYEKQCDEIAEAKKEQRKIVEPPSPQPAIQDSENDSKNTPFEISNTPFGKSNTPFGKSNHKEYNINNTYINNNKTTTTNNKKTKPAKAVSKVVVVDSNNQDITQEVITAYKNSFGKKPAHSTLKIIIALLHRFEWDAIEHAMLIASGKGKQFDYARGIMKKWQENNAYTIDNIFEYDERYAGRRQIDA